MCVWTVRPGCKSITTRDAISAYAKLVEHPLETYFCPMDKNEVSIGCYFEGKVYHPWANTFGPRFNYWHVPQILVAPSILISHDCCNSSNDVVIIYRVNDYVLHDEKLNQNNRASTAGTRWLIDDNVCWRIVWFGLLACLVLLVLQNIIHGNSDWKWTCDIILLVYSGAMWNTDTSVHPAQMSLCWIAPKRSLVDIADIRP